VVSPADYTTLVTRLREAEEAVEDAEPVAGLELRTCPECSVRMEKNQGCESMTCYRCGHDFRWSSADLVVHGAKKKKKKTAASKGAAGADQSLFRLFVFKLSRGFPCVC
jgi:hypothetical protein